CPSAHPPPPSLPPLSLHDALPIYRCLDHIADAHLARAVLALALEAAQLEQVPDRAPDPVGLGDDPPGQALGDLRVALVVERLGQDRKSTRLNSSHVKISYAVFCLK